MGKVHEIMNNFVLMLLVFTSVVSAAWETTVDSDPITDETVVLLTCRASSGANSWGERPYLCVRFTDGESIELFVFWDTYVGSSDLSCIVRIDDAEAQAYRVSASTSSQHTFFQSTSTKERLFVEMLDGAEFICRFTPYGENPITAIFSLYGFTSATTHGGIDLDSYRERVTEVILEESTISYEGGTLSIGGEILFNEELHILLEIRRLHGSSDFSRLRLVPKDEYINNESTEGYWVTNEQLINQEQEGEEELIRPENDTGTLR